MLEEFKKFALRGNVVDLAVGVVIGVAFGAIVTSLVGDIIMPIIGAITGGLILPTITCRSLPRCSGLATGCEEGGRGSGLWSKFLTVALNLHLADH